MTGWMTGFATIQYAEGMDHSRNAPGRMASVIPSSQQQPERQQRPA